MTFWETLATALRTKKGGSCHATGKDSRLAGLKAIAIVGNPNVGKSLVFNRLTGAYATVSNYPGTTVSVFRGKTRLNGQEFQVVDTPGMYSLLPISEEERVARTILLEEKPDVVLQVVDAKNLERMLPFTLQLIEAGLPIVLDLNMMDETEAAGVVVDTSQLEAMLGIPVVATAATTGHGLDALRQTLSDYARHESGSGKI
ncbi:MAG: 50S ribosome-binding GTPase [Chloroflexi bacterium]|nr:50S ribosome-binding GTPase [Chloroflexota bacterium]